MPRVTSRLNEILLDSHEVREIGPSLFTAVPERAAPATYDRKSGLYDAVVGHPLYHRTMWGTSARAYTQFGYAAAEAAEGSWFAEAGCGSLLFTHAMYRDPHGPPTALVDRSLRMLRRGMARVPSAGEESGRTITWLHADAAALPIRSAAFQSILSLNLLHVPCDAAGIARELGRLLRPGHGRLFLSCLVLSGRWSDAYLRALHRAGELGRPRTAEALGPMVAQDWGEVDSCRVEGNVCFMVVRHAGRSAKP